MNIKRPGRWLSRRVVSRFEAQRSVRNDQRGHIPIHNRGVLGHKTPASTKRFAHLVTVSLAGAVAKIGARKQDENSVSGRQTHTPDIKPGIFFSEENRETLVAEGSRSRIDLRASDVLSWV